MKRLLSLSVIAFAAAAAVVVPVVPAAATTAEPVTLKVGQTLLIKRPAITGVSTVYQANSKAIPGAPLNLPNSGTPADCAGEQFGCEVVPITWAVPDEDDPDRIEAEQFILEVTVAWDAGQTVENVQEVGDIQQNRVEAWLYQDPMERSATGTPSFSGRSNGANPASMAVVAPPSNKFELVVANMHGVNNGYTLQVSLTNGKAIEFDPNEFAKPKPGDGGDYVQPQIPDSATPRDSGFGGAVAPPPPFAAPGPGIIQGPQVVKPIVVPNIADGRADGTLLSMSRISIPSGLGKTGAVDVTSKVSVVQNGKSSGTAVSLGLLALPMLFLLTGLFLAYRKRKGSAPAEA